MKVGFGFGVKMGPPPGKPGRQGVASGALVHPSARLGKDVYIGPFAVIGEDVSIVTESPVLAAL